MSKKNISIKEIAELSGVSVATVSRVINNNGRFSEETRQKVLSVIEETNYETNNVAKSLRMKKSNTIGILVPDISNSFFASVVRKLESYFFEEGYSTIICNTDRNREKELTYLKILESKMIDGLIVIAGPQEFETERLNKKIPIVCIDRKPKDNQEIVLVHSDNFQGGFIAAEEMIQKGCKKIALLAQHETVSSFKERRKGFEAALEKYGFSFNEEYFVEVNLANHTSQMEAAKSTLLKKFRDGVKYDGIFALNDRMAIGAIEATLEFRYKIPEDIKIIGFDNDPISRYCHPKLTTIKQDTKLLAQKTCFTLLDLIDNTSTNEKHQIIPIELIKRETT